MLAQENNSNIFRFYRLLISIVESSLVDLWDRLNLMGKPLTEDAQSAAYLKENTSEWLYQAKTLETAEPRERKIIECGEENLECFEKLFSWLTWEQVRILKKLADRAGVNIQFLVDHKNRQEQEEMRDFFGELSTLDEEAQKEVIETAINALIEKIDQPVNQQAAMAEPEPSKI